MSKTKVRIEDKLQTLNHLESSVIAPSTSIYIETNREAIETIQELRRDPPRYFVMGFIAGLTLFVSLYLILKPIFG